MNLVIELPDDELIALKAKAQRKGFSAEAYVRQVIEEDLKEARSPEGSAATLRISHVIAQIMADAPPEELAKLPKDGASEHDHYIYGWPKRRR